MGLVGLNMEFSGWKLKGTEQFPSLLLAEEVFLTWDSELR